MELGKKANSKLVQILKARNFSFPPWFKPTNRQLIDGNVENFSQKEKEHEVRCLKQNKNSIRRNEKTIQNSGLL